MSFLTSARVPADGTSGAGESALQENGGFGKTCNLPLT